MSTTALAGKSRWLLAPSNVSSVVSGTLAIYYATLVVNLPEHSVQPFVIVAGLLLFVLVAYGDFRLQAGLPTLRRMERGELPESEANLIAVAKELTAISDHVFVQGCVFWVGGALLAGMGLKLVDWDRIDVLLLLRVGVVGLLVGPPAAMLSSLLVMRRSRVLIESLSTRVPLRVLLQALPVNRTQLRARLVAFAAISVIFPALVVFDGASALSRQGLDAIVQAEPGEQARVAAHQERSGSLKVVVLLVLVLGVSTGAASLAGEMLSAPMRNMADEANKIARGELTKPRLVAADDELWAVSAAFTRMHLQLYDALASLRDAGLRISGSADRMVLSAARYEEGATYQATALNETSATTEELARSARQIAENATAVADIATRTSSAAEAGQESAEVFASAIGRLKQDHSAIVESVMKLSKRVKQIGRIVEFINAVADKSDLLALNAELEGIKAGEVGRGFSLVAGETRRLAENVLESTNEIEGLIEEIRDATSAAVTVTEAGVKTAEGSLELAGSVSDSLRAIGELALKTSTAVRAISLATQQQQTGTTQLADAMADIMRITHDAVTARKGAVSTNQELGALASEVKGVVERFRIG